MDSFDILVIILSITLAIFLLLAIIATTLIIKVMTKVNRIAESAEVVAANIENASNTIKSAAGPAAIVKIIMSAVNAGKRQ